MAHYWSVWTSDILFYLSDWIPFIDIYWLLKCFQSYWLSEAFVLCWKCPKILESTNGEVQPRHPNPLWCPPLPPYSTESATKSPYWLGTVFPASAQPISVMFALQWLQPVDEQFCVQRHVVILWSSNTNKIGRTEFPYIRTDGMELTSWFAQAFCYKLRTFQKRTENIPVRKANASAWELLKSELTITMIISSTHTMHTSAQPSAFSILLFTHFPEYHHSRYRCHFFALQHFVVLRAFCASHQWRSEGGAEGAKCHRRHLP